MKLKLEAMDVHFCKNVNFELSISEKNRTTEKSSTNWRLEKSRYREFRATGGRVTGGSPVPLPVYEAKLSF